MEKLHACKDSQEEEAQSLRRLNTKLAMEMQLQRAQFGKAALESEAAPEMKDRTHAVDKLQISILEN
eukprot:8085487-Karenia_brevis.AAC.1